MRISPKTPLRRLATIVFVTLITIPLLTSSAQADPDQSIMERICPVDSYPEIEIVDSGISSVITGPNYFDDSIDPHSDSHMLLDSTVYGQYGTAGLSWHYIQAHCMDGWVSIIPRFLGDSMFSWAKGIGHTTIVVYQYALSAGFLVGVEQFFSDVIVNMRDGLWRPLIPTVVILGAVWMAWVGLIKKRFTLSVEGAVWMIAATVFGFWMMAHPHSLMQTTNTFINGITATVNQLVSSALQGQHVGGINYCPAGIYRDSDHLDPEQHNGIEKAEWESHNHYYIRVTSENLYTNLLCRPWGKGQFGGTVEGESAFIHSGADLFISQSVGRVEHDYIRDQSRDNANYFQEEVVSEKNQLFDETKETMQQLYPDVYPSFAGDRPWERSGVAFITLIANILVAAMVITLSIVLLVAKFSLLLALLLFPIIGLIGIHPGYGKIVLKRWIELVVGLILKQILISFIVSVFVGMTANLFAWGDLGRGVLGMVVFLISIIAYRHHLSRIFAATDGATAVDRITSKAVQLGPEIKRASNAIPIVAYGRMQAWGWRNKHKVAAAAVGVGAAAGRSATASAGPEQAPPLRGLRGRAARHLERVTDPPESAPALRPASAGENTDGKSTGRSSTVAETPRSGHTPSRRKGMLARGASAGDRSTPEDTSTPRTSSRAPVPVDAAPPASVSSVSPRGRRPEDAPSRPRRAPVLGRQWEPPRSLRGAVPWAVPRKKGLPGKLFPFGDRRGKK